MKKPQLSLLIQIFDVISKSKLKYLTAEMVSLELGIYPDKISETCAYFNPLATIDYSFDLKSLQDQIETYIKENEKKPSKPKTKPVEKKILPYESVTDFVYQKMTFSGLVDQSAHLSDADLRLLRKLISEELKNRKLASKKSK